MRDETEKWMHLERVEVIRKRKSLKYAQLYK